MATCGVQDTHGPPNDTTTSFFPFLDITNCTVPDIDGPLNTAARE